MQILIIMFGKLILLIWQVEGSTLWSDHVIIASLCKNLISFLIRFSQADLIFPITPLSSHLSGFKSGSCTLTRVVLLSTGLTFYFMLLLKLATLLEMCFTNKGPLSFWIKFGLMCLNL